MSGSLRPIIIRGGLVARPADGTVGPADILVKDGLIAEIGPPGLPAPDEAEVMDATDRLIMPGLVNAHTHSHLAIARGLSRSWTLELHLHNGPWTGGGQRFEDRRFAPALFQVVTARRDDQVIGIRGANHFPWDGRRMLAGVA